MQSRLLGACFYFFLMCRWRSDLRKEAKEELLWNVERSSPADKIRDFLERCRVIMADMRYLKKLQESSPATRFLLANSSLWHTCTWVCHRKGPQKRAAEKVFGGRLTSACFVIVFLWLTLLLNIMTLVSWEAPINFEQPIPTINNAWSVEIEERGKEKEREREKMCGMRGGGVLLSISLADSGALIDLFTVVLPYWP